MSRIVSVLEKFIEFWIIFQNVISMNHHYHCLASIIYNHSTCPLLFLFNIGFKKKIVYALNRLFVYDAHQRTNIEPPQIVSMQIMFLNVHRYFHFEFVLVLSPCVETILTMSLFSLRY